MTAHDAANEQSLMETSRPAPAELPDLDICSKEPIRIPGGIQPHGALLVIDQTSHRIHQRSANAGDLLGATLLEGDTLQKGVETSIDGLLQDLDGWLARDAEAFDRTVQVGGKWLAASARRGDQGVILEFEPAGPGIGNESYYARLRHFVDTAEEFDTVESLAAATAREVRQMTGFHRVMIYRFDEAWNGTVVAEDGDGTLPSYLDLRFPASDIPAQARELYRQNRIRLIPDARYIPVALEPELSPLDGQPTDLSFAALRSVSPVHLEYMRNMGTDASMSVSLLMDGKLWGLISCHHAAPRHVPPPVRTACEFLGRIVSQQIASFERAREITQRLAFKRLETELVAHLSRSPSFQQGLVERPRQWLGLTNAEGAAVITEGMILTTGSVPSTPFIQELANWLHAREIETVFATDHLSGEWEPAKAHTATASGLVAVPISKLHPSFILWFRPEVVRTVKWGGNPVKVDQDAHAMRIHPRKSFDTWKENVREHSQNWHQAEIYSGADFRNAVVNFVLRRAEERAELTEELQRSNRELESFSYSISHDLRAPFRHILGYAQLLGEEEAELKSISRHYLEGISSAALSAGQLVDDLLRFSQLGRASLSVSRIDMQKVSDEIRRSFDDADDHRTVEWRIGKLPDGYGDAALIRQALFNLADNAYKYTRDRNPAIIEISGTETPLETRYTVKDNGVGFDMAYAGKLFQVFQRLHHVEDFEGTGIGLALSKRIVDRHGGAIVAEGSLGSGAAFSFTLPKPKKAKKT